MAATDYTTGSAYVNTASPNYVISSPATATWTAGMVGRSIQFTDDGFWYEISTLASPTQIIVKRNISQAISEGAYTISELIPLPYGYQDLPLYGALFIYFNARKDQIAQAREWERQYQAGLEKLLRRDAKSVGTVFTKSDLEDMVGLYNINDFPEDIS